MSFKFLFRILLLVFMENIWNGNKWSFAKGYLWSRNWNLWLNRDKLKFIEIVVNKYFDYVYYSFWLIIMLGI